MRLQRSSTAAPTVSPVIRLIGFACVLLMLTFGCVQAIHVHSDNNLAHEADCGLCAAAHQAATAVLIITLGLLPPVAVPVFRKLRFVTPPQEFFVEFASRPPPAWL